MKILPLVLVAVAVSALTALATVKMVGNAGGGAAVREGAYERVMRTGVLRCGYADWPPFMLKQDPATGKISGLVPDVVEAMAKKLSLKVEWTENVGWNSITALQSGRIDAFCAGAWRNSERGKSVISTTPMFYSPIYPYVRVGDHRFDGDLRKVNDPRYRVSAMDGEQSDIVATHDFPEAKKVSVPQLGQVSDILMNVADGKADIVFTEPVFVSGFIKANPGKLRKLQSEPYQVFETAPVVVDIHEPMLRDMLDGAVVEILNFGEMDKIIDRYNTDRSVIMRLAKPYTEVRE